MGQCTFFSNNRDEILTQVLQALDHIGEIYFRIQIRRPTNILDMMGSMFGGGGSSERQAQQIAGGGYDLD